METKVGGKKKKQKGKKNKSKNKKKDKQTQISKLFGEIIIPIQKYESWSGINLTEIMIKYRTELARTYFGDTNELYREVFSRGIMGPFTNLITGKSEAKKGASDRDTLIQELASIKSNTNGEDLLNRVKSLWWQADGKLKDMIFRENNYISILTGEKLSLESAGIRMRYALELKDDIGLGLLLLYLYNNLGAGEMFHQELLSLYKITMNTSGESYKYSYITKLLLMTKISELMLLTGYYLLWFWESEWRGLEIQNLKTYLNKLHKDLYEIL